MGTILAIVLPAGVISLCLFAVVREKKTNRSPAAGKPTICPTDRAVVTSSSEYEVILPGGLHFCYDLGALQSNGWKVNEGNGKAIEWYIDAASQGYVDAQFNLGMHYIDGTGVPQNYVRAYGWLNLAAAAGDSHAGNLRDDLCRCMSREQIGEAQRLSYEWFETHRRGSLGVVETSIA